MKKIKNGKEMAEALSDFVNYNPYESIEFAETVVSEHRYLQQSMFNMMLKCIEFWADNYDKGVYDDRNNYAVNASKKMIEALKKEGLF